MRAICVPCQQQYLCERNDVIVEAPGELWCTDKYKCPGCGHEMIPATRPEQRPFCVYHNNPARYETARVIEPPEVILP